MTLTDSRQEVTEMKGQIKTESKAEATLRNRIQILKTRCQEMEETVSSLDHVREAIQVLDACPGISRPEFHVPLWTGKWISDLFDPLNYTDDEIDEQMDAYCKSKGTYKGMPVRAAETSEIE